MNEEVFAAPGLVSQADISGRHWTATLDCDTELEHYHGAAVNRHCFKLTIETHVKLIRVLVI